MLKVVQKLDLTWSKYCLFVIVFTSPSVFGRLAALSSFVEDIVYCNRVRQSFKQCCGSGIQCLFDPWIRDGKNPDPGSNHYF